MPGRGGLPRPVLSPAPRPGVVPPRPEAGAPGPWHRSRSACWSRYRLAGRRRHGTCAPAEEHRHRGKGEGEEAERQCRTSTEHAANLPHTGSLAASEAAGHADGRAGRIGRVIREQPGDGTGDLGGLSAATSGTVGATTSGWSGSGWKPVQMVPGATPFTRIPSRATSF